MRLRQEVSCGRGLRVQHLQPARRAAQVRHSPLCGSISGSYAFAFRGSFCCPFRGSYRCSFYISAITGSIAVTISSTLIAPHQRSIIGSIGCSFVGTHIDPYYCDECPFIGTDCSTLYCSLCSPVDISPLCGSYSRAVPFAHSSADYRPL